MCFSVPSNILFLLFCFLLLDILDEILLSTFSTIAEVISEMNNHTLISHYGIEPDQSNISFLTSLYTLSLTSGTFVSIFVFLPTAETKGRRFVTIYYRLVLIFFAAVFQLFSFFFQASEFYLVSQFVIGIEHPLRTFLTILFITECAPDKNRGFASTALIFATVFGRGLLFSFGSPEFFGRANTWFVFPLFVMISSLALFALTYRLQESPKWLTCQNRMEEAKRSIEFYHGNDCSLDEVVMTMVKEKNLTNESQVSFRQVFGDITLREALFLLFSNTFFFLLDSTSIQAVYTVPLHKDAGFTVQETMNINLILTIIFFPTKFIGTFIIDTLGRRPVMFVAGVICLSKSVLMVLTQSVIYFIGSSLLTKIMYVGVEVLTGAIPATGVTSLHILFVAELFPPSARTPVAQVMIIAAVIVDTPMLTLFPFIYSYFSPVFFLPFVISQIVFGTYLYRHMPETKGRPVCDIIESLEQTVTSRAQSLLEEKTPLIRERARTLAIKRNSILNTSRTRAATYDQTIIPKNIHIY